MKLTIEATDPAEIAQLAGYLAGVKPSSGVDVCEIQISRPAVCDGPKPFSPPTQPVEPTPTSGDTQVAQINTDQGAKKRGRPKKSPEVSTVATSADGSADYVPPSESSDGESSVTSPADEGVEYETATDVLVPTVEEVRAILTVLADASGITVAGQLIDGYTETRKAQDVPEDKRAELVAKAKELIAKAAKEREAAK